MLGIRCQRRFATGPGGGERDYRYRKSALEGVYLLNFYTLGPFHQDI